MYVSRQHYIDPKEAIEIARKIGVGELITYGSIGINATRLPFVIEERGGSLVLSTHMSRVNPQWRDEGEALYVVGGPDAHVAGHYLPPESPTARMPLVPTWDYLTVHLRGKLSIYDDAAWKWAHVQRIVDHHELVWRPETHSQVERIERAFSALVGIELEISEVLGKAKLHQNMSPADIAHIADNLAQNNAVDIAQLMHDISIPWARERNERITAAVKGKDPSHIEDLNPAHDEGSY
ncbi:MAG: FMN-binding negative transcriptional regulator [Actinomycetaceae bacterium]|nr:FMN-binding negative transcriptional regulator [Actinomycetaceae bacterium]